MSTTKRRKAPNRTPGPKRTKTRRLFVIGAGASYAAGLPDASHLPAQVFGYIGNAPWEVVRNRPPSSYFNALTIVLQSVLQTLSTGGMQSKWPMDAVFERFGELIRENPHRFALPFGQLFEATAQLLYERSHSGGRTEAYSRFAEALTEDDLILTFNWDVCLEIAMQRVRKRLQRSLHPKASKGPHLLKLNGSIDHLIVNTSTSGKVARSSSESSWWTQFPFLERLNVRAPSAPDTSWTTSASHYELARLRTYDLKGYEMALSDRPFKSNRALRPGPPFRSIGKDAIDEGTCDVGAFAFIHTLPEYPSIHMIVPGTPAGLSRWYYDAIRLAIAPFVSQITRVYVVGYSFPVYDLPLIRLLRDIVQSAGNPPGHIVNPDAAKLPREPLRYIFGRGQIELHPLGFEAFDWTS